MTFAQVRDDQPRSGIGETNYHRVRDAIRHDIIQGIFLADSRLKISDLVKRYGVSAAPIREALGQLEADGLIILEPNRGAKVRKLDRSLVDEIFEIRIGLEPLLVGKCVALAQPVDVERTRAIETLFEAAIQASDLPSVLRLNSRFHASIYQIRPNREALRLMSQHSDLMAAFRYRHGFAKERYPQIVDEHAALIEACRKQDGAAGEAIMRQHIGHSWEDLHSRMS